MVSVEWLKNNITDQNIILLDTRPKTMFLYGHLPNSQSLTVEQVIQFDQYGSNLVGDEKKICEIFSNLGIDETKIVIVFGDQLDVSSARIAWTLLYYGHENTHLLDSSVSELKEKGFEFTRKITTVHPTSFKSKINSNIRITADDLKENLSNFEILDARTLQEFMMGHLPKSKLIPFTEGIAINGTLFKRKETLRNIFSQINISKDSEIVCYCMHVHRASSLFFQLVSAGYEKIRLYDGSFVEWHGRGFPLE